MLIADIHELDRFTDCLACPECVALAWGRIKTELEILTAQQPTHVKTSVCTPQPQLKIIPCGRTENCGYFASLQCDGTDNSFCYDTE